MFAHGVGGKMLGWIQNWLLDRKQKVSINGTYSRWQNVQSGVPQGSVLGPFLFLVYINDIDQGVVSKLCKFADDTKFGAKVGDTFGVENVRADLKSVYQW